MTEIFVDATGRRRQRVRRIGYAFGATCLLYTALVGTSVVGGVTGPEALAPFPSLGDLLPGGTPVRKPPPPVAATAQAEARRSPLRADRLTRLAAPKRAAKRPAAPAPPSSNPSTPPVLESTAEPAPTGSPSPAATPEPEPTPTDPATQPAEPESSLPVIELPESPMALPDPAQTPLRATTPESTLQ